MRNRYLFLVFFISLFMPLKRELYISNTTKRDNLKDYEKLLDTYRDLKDSEYFTIKYDEKYKRDKV